MKRLELTKRQTEYEKAMQEGPNEFVVTGTMKNWEGWSDLPRIRIRTLLNGS
jgi:hypothetical protein